MGEMIELGVNIDHVATLRQARQANEPDPVWAAALAQLGGASGITVHLREDRRHIQDRDVRILRETVTVKLNLEMACTPEITHIACEVRPDQATLVPEKRLEITTEGGLDCVAPVNCQRVSETIRALHDAQIAVSLFLDPDIRQIEMAKELGADAVEIHTGAYANALTQSRRNQEVVSIIEAGKRIVDLGMSLHAGHGLTYHNLSPIVRIPGMHELNIGHSIMARAIMIGLQNAVREMRELINQTV
ncbi:MAG: pyridoxine 5'-phosphate synthase [Thermoguttaceae bacterium]|nr:pyridoxine 5'-phosphate synthase [Thermoguttaceae bacterium]